MTATTIALTPGSGTTESGTLATGLTTDLYQFSGTAGQSLYFKSLKDTPTDYPAVLYGPATPTSRQFYVDSDAAVKLPSTGTYLLAIAGRTPPTPR